MKADRDIFTQFYAGIDINRSDLGTIFYNADEVGADPEGKLLPKAAMKGLIRKQRRQTVASGDPFHTTSDNSRWEAGAGVVGGIYSF